jgi:chromosomal replication initiation ATPase DnaA
VLIIAARTAGGPAYQERIEEMDRELMKVIEDFMRTVDVEALCSDKRMVSTHGLNLATVHSQRLHVDQGKQDHVEQELLIRWLKPVETGYHQDLRCMAGTRKVILKEIIDWVASTPEQGDVVHSNTYWIYGLPGIGKTSLAHSICANLHDHAQLAGAFFCRRDDPNLSETRNILPTLIHKLAIISPAFRSIVAERLHKDPNVTPESMNAHSLP